MDETYWELEVAFPNPSVDFALGFEAGILWQCMTDAEEAIERIVHSANKPAIESMARLKGYDYAWLSTDEDGWEDVALTKHKGPARDPKLPKLRIVRR